MFVGIDHARVTLIGDRHLGPDNGVDRVLNRSDTMFLPGRRRVLRQTSRFLLTDDLHGCPQLGSMPNLRLFGFTSGSAVIRPESLARVFDNRSIHCAEFVVCNSKGSPR